MEKEPIMVPKTKLTRKIVIFVATPHFISVNTKGIVNTPNIAALCVRKDKNKKAKYKRYCFLYPK